MPEPSTRRPTPIVRRILHVVVLGAVLALALAFVDFSNVWRMLLSVRPPYLILMLLLATASRLLMSWKWFLLLEATGVEVPFSSTVKAYYQSSVISYIPFLVLGADLFRIHEVSKEKGEAPAVIASVVMERAQGLISAFLLGTVGLFITVSVHSSEQATLLGVVSVGGLIASVLLLAISLRDGVHRHGLRLLEKWMPDRLRRGFERFSQAFRSMKGQHLVLAKTIALAILEHLVQFLVLFVAGRAIGVVQPAVLFLAAISLAMVARRLAIYLEGWSLAHAVSVFLFSVLGIGVDQALALSLLGDAVSAAASLPGVVLLVVRPPGLAEKSNSKQS